MHLNNTQYYWLQVYNKYKAIFTTLIGTYTVTVEPIIYNSQIQHKTINLCSNN